MNKKTVPTPIQYPVVFVIFGATGDLSEKKLFPALFALFRKKLLPQRFRIVAFARRPFTDAAFAELIAPSLVGKGTYNDEIAAFLSHVVYHQGQFDDPRAYISLIHRLGDIDKELEACSHKIFHLAISPFQYETVLKQIHASSLNISCTDGTGYTRILLEKPIGEDMHSAQHLDAVLASIFKEDQIFRIDHYLMKPALIDLLSLHLHNPALKVVWNDTHIESMTFSLLEKEPPVGRGAFYDRVGALRDVGQNHLLEMVALALADSHDSTPRMRAHILATLHVDVSRPVASGQYDGFLNEEGVVAGSLTESAFIVPFTSTLATWKNTGFVIQSGKALAASGVSLLATFRSEVELPWGDQHYKVKAIEFRIQPDPAVLLHTQAGNAVSLSLAKVLAHIARHPLHPEQYEKVYYDALFGDETFFVSRAEVEHAWAFIDAARTELTRQPLKKYPIGSPITHLLQ
jgi:glucose-6-phosphate 1-dehydrogenase